MKPNVVNSIYLSLVRQNAVWELTAYEVYFRILVSSIETTFKIYLMALF